MSRKIKLDNVLPLKHFLRQNSVVKMYREFLRACVGLEKETRVDLESQIKFEFRKNQAIKDVIVIKSLLTEGKRTLEIVQAMNPSKIIQDKDAWINSTSDPSDKKGRVGEGWPWG